MGKEKHEFMKKLDSCYGVVQQSSTKGVSAIEIANKLRIHRTTVHRYLNSLELMGKVYSEKGLWFPTDAKQKTIRDLPSEIRAEVKRIKEDFINQKVESAFRRLSLLLNTQILVLKLPEDLEKELNSLISEYKEKYPKFSVWEELFLGMNSFEKKRAELLETMIPKFLKLITKICKKLEEGERA